MGMIRLQAGSYTGHTMTFDLNVDLDRERSGYFQ
jgi:hypothetical protein